MPQNRTNVVLIALGIIVLGAIAYLLWGKGDTSAAVESVAPMSEAELTFLNLTAQIEPVSFDTSILSDPRFTSLVDLRTAIVPETSGRTDPFGPFGR